MHWRQMTFVFLIDCLMHCIRSVGVAILLVITRFFEAALLQAAILLEPVVRNTFFSSDLANAMDEVVGSLVYLKLGK